MVSRLFSTAGSYLNSFGEVLAPSSQSALDDLKNHWRAIKAFYIDQKEDIESFQASQLPEHLVSMVNILSDEEKKVGETGPAVEFFLQNKIFETLCILGERDTPPGVRKLILVAITLLFSNISLPLLPHMSVHKPLKSLIRKCTMAPRASSSQKSFSTNHASSVQVNAPHPDSEFVNLLEVLTAKLKDHPTLIGFFLDDPASPPSSPIIPRSPGGVQQAPNVYAAEDMGSLILFQALLKHLWDPGAIGERARRALVACLTLPFPSSSLHESSPPSSTIPPAAVPSATTSLTPSSPRANTTSTPPTTPGGPTQPEVKAPINFSRFCYRTVLGLIEIFRRLPPMIPLPLPPPPGFNSNPSVATSPPVDLALLEHFKTYIAFLSTLSELTQHNIGTAITKHFEDLFLMSALGPSLLQPLDIGAASTTLYVREAAPLFSSNLQRLFLSFLIGDFTGPERPDEEGEHFIRATLVRRMTAPSEVLATATCRLFSALIGMHDRHALDNLVVRNLVSGRYRVDETPEGPNPAQAILNHTVIAQDFTPETIEHIQSSISSFLTVFNGLHVSARSGYDAYLADSQHQLALYRAACKEWAAETASSKSTTATKSTSSLNTLGESTPRGDQDGPIVGSFVSQLFAKLENALDRDLESNLVVTGIFAKLCYYPMPALASYLLSHSMTLAPGVPSLYGTLDKLAQEIRARAAYYEDFQASLERMRQELAMGGAHSTLPPPPSALDDAAPSGAVVQAPPTPSKAANPEAKPAEDAPAAQPSVAPERRIAVGSEKASDKRFLQAAIVLEEFSKELAAILQAKIVLVLQTHAR
eukprot:TRINITY_DN11619_c0_g1_i2.p1 TRINITY_DN11619_c0_g1~~TRINITY_DN11619_c0_g1_i2.p1  ORF type:complete len:830 (-),score=231.43 TRINITY_DN11619_c0_g1_i2:7-2454(-)